MCHLYTCGIIRNQVLRHKGPQVAQELRAGAWAQLVNESGDLGKILLSLSTHHV